MNQLEEVGISRRGRERRLHSGRLHRVHRGVYAVGHAGLSGEGQLMAAVLAYPRGVVSHHSAAALWALLPSPSLAHLTVPGKGGHGHRRGIRVHHSVDLSSSQVTRRHGFPVTTPGRTLADLRRMVPRKRFVQMVRQAEYLRLPLDRDLGQDQTRSELEGRFLAFCRRHRLPRPVVNARIGRYIVDFVWPETRLVVELDGYRAHGTRAAFEADRERDAELKLRGWDVVRITWRRLEGDPAEVARTLRALLRR